MGGCSGGQWEKVCPGCISENVRCNMLILGREIGWGGGGDVGVQASRSLYDLTDYECQSSILCVLLNFIQFNL